MANRLAHIDDPKHCNIKIYECSHLPKFTNISPSFPSFKSFNHFKLL